MKLKLIRTVLGTTVLLSALVGCKGTGICAADAHKWDAGVITTEPTDKTDGIRTYTCTVCKSTKSEIVPKTGTSDCNHVYDNGVVTTEPTETSDGIKTYTCTICGDKKLETIPKKGSSVVEEKFTVTYNANGGTGDGIVDLNEYSKGEYVTVKNNGFTAPEGMEFINWNEEADGSGGYHNAGSRFKIYENVTLYAQWLEKEEDDPNREYNIRVNAPEGVTYELSNTAAKEGTQITLTLTLSDGTTLNGNPTSSQVALTKGNGNVYTFTMPASAVTINVRTTIDGDVVLSGDISAKLTDPDNDGIYSADYVCDVNTYYDFTYVVKDNDGNPVKLSSMKLDETKCDASVTFNSSGTNQLRIDGGATYTFYYDSNLKDYNCYVVRKSVDVLPRTSSMLYSLFTGSMRSNSTIHPQGLTGITYTKTVTGSDATLGYKNTDTEYVYKKLSDTESFAVATNALNANKKSYVYKNIDATNGVYSIVNTYTKDEGNNEASDNVWTLDPYGNLQADAERYFPYSARQDIVENSKYRDLSRYEITSREAYRNVKSAAHYGSDLEYEIWQGIRGDFDGTNVINAANGEGSHINVTSTKMGSQGFQTRVESQLEYNHEESGSTADVTQQYAFIYDITFVFKTNGDLYRLDYNEDYYTKDNWDFAKHAPKTGAHAITTTITVANEFDKTYNRADVLGDFNPDDYFISSIDSLALYNKVGGAKENNRSVLNYDDSLDIYEYLGGGQPRATVDKFEFSPATALDAWQYGFISSTDEGVAADTVYGPKAVGEGTATVTYGNHLKNMNGPTKDIDVVVYAHGTFRSLFINCTVTGYDSNIENGHADYCYGIAGRTMTFYIDSSSNTGCPVSYWMKIRTYDRDTASYVLSDTSEYFNIVNKVGTVHDSSRNLDYAKIVGNALTLDFNTEASNALTKEVVIDVIFESNFYETGYGPKINHISIKPAQAPLANSKFHATYMQSANASAKYEDVDIEFYSGGTGKLTETVYNTDGTTVKTTNVLNFSYTELNNGHINAHVTSVAVGESGWPANANAYTLVFEMQQSGLLGVCMYFEDSSGIEVIFGTAYEEDEYGVTVETLDGFERV